MSNTNAFLSITLTEVKTTAGLIWLNLDNVRSTTNSANFLSVILNPLKISKTKN